ncbi:MAG: hypothetical protein AAGG68_28960, partial [Bacteroidota bacterium]
MGQKAFITKNGALGLSSIPCSMIQLLRKRWVYHSLVWIGFYAILLLFDFIIGTRTYSLFEFLR